MIFGADPKTLYASVMSPVFLIGPIAISHWDLRALAVTISLALALAAFLRFTKDGQFLSAVADNSELAEIYGIGLARAYAISMVLAAILVVAGMYPATPLNQFLVLAVIATILAGIGNVFAAGTAAIALGMIQTFSILVISSTWQIMIIYVLIFVTILLFPSGVVLKRPWRRITRDAAVVSPPESKNGQSLR
jgi:branched-chain amino acid transport system permease protein